MYTSKLKPAACSAVALAAVLALGACGKKVDDTPVVPVTPAPMSNPSPMPSSSNSGSTMGSNSSNTSMGGLGSSTMGTSTMGAGIPPPTPAASASVN